MTYDYIKINGVQIPRPPGFAPKREDVYEGEITTCTGKLIADKIGWKYAEMELQWDALTQDEVDILVNMNGISTITFDDADGEEHTEQVVTISKVWLRHRHTIKGKTIWKGVSVGVRFINVHN